MTTTKRQREDLAGEAEQQHKAMTAAHREDTIDSKDQELLALIENRKNMERKETAQARDIRKKIEKNETTKDPKDIGRYRTFLKSVKKQNRARISRQDRKILITHVRNEAGGRQPIVEERNC